MQFARIFGTSNQDFGVVKSLKRLQKRKYVCTDDLLETDFPDFVRKSKLSGRISTFATL